MSQGRQKREVEKRKKNKKRKTKDRTLYIWQLKNNKEKKKQS